jgi:hypothetical protein
MSSPRINRNDQHHRAHHPPPGVRRGRLTYGLTKSYDVGYIILIVIAAIALVLISMVRRTYNPEV